MKITQLPNKLNIELTIAEYKVLVKGYTADDDTFYNLDELRLSLDISNQFKKIDL